MEKRQRTEPSQTHAADHPSDSMPCSSGRNLTIGENSFDPDYGNVFKPFSVKEITDGQGKQLNTPLPLSQHHYNISRAMFSKRSRHNYKNHYSRRNSANYQSHRPSSSGKGTPFRDERLCFKLGGGYNPEFGHRPDFREFREKAFWQPERIRRSSSVVEGVSLEGSKMVCVICQKPLTRKLHPFGSTVAPEELSIIAVLVCGHIYHADCLEQRTRIEDIRDPPCPTCQGLVTKTEVA
uniref:RING-type domain-containing protein n=1 Tax=Opuntia streptacantha TaxID=393608 RepID=A0A7C9DJE4_OPUST